MLTSQVVCKKCLQADIEAQRLLLVFVELEGPFCRAAFYCLVLLCNKLFGWSLSLTPWRMPLNSWHFLSDRSVFVIYGRSLDSFKVWAGHAGKIHPCD